MILKASQRSGAKQLGAHLLKTEENEHVEIHEVSGFVADTVQGAMMEAYATRAAEKLRRFGLKAGAMQVFMRTNEHNGDPWYSNQATFEVEPTSDSLALIASATRVAHGLWRQGFRYAKAGIVLLDLYKPDELPVADMFATRDPERSKALMGALDAINGRFGRETVKPGGLTGRGEWSMRSANLSPCYTTRLADLMEVRS